MQKSAVHSTGIACKAKTVNGLGAVWKSLQPLLDLAQKAICVRLAGQTVTYVPPERVGLSPTLWRRDGCWKCGRSCRGFALAFLPGEPVPEAVKTMADVIELAIDDTPGEVLLYRQRKLRGDRGCDWLTGSIGTSGSCACSIHTLKPMHCWMPHMRIQRNRRLDCVFIMRSQYGRNWALGCPVNLMLPADERQFLADQDRLGRMYDLSKALAIPSKLPAIIAAHRAQGIHAPRDILYV